VCPLEWANLDLWNIVELISFFVITLHYNLYMKPWKLCDFLIIVLAYRLNSYSITLKNQQDKCFSYEPIRDVLMSFNIQQLWIIGKRERGVTKYISIIIIIIIIVTVLREIRVEHVTSTSLEYYPYTNPLGQARRSFYLVAPVKRTSHVMKRRFWRTTRLRTI
jgi:hypothetical protein